MILPFSTNQWNVIRFVALTLVSVPIIECALRKVHQLQAARRILNGKPVCIRASRLANWVLHQELDELNYRSKIMIIVVAIIYVGLMLCIELSSGSVQAEAKSTWMAPAFNKTDVKGKPLVYDTSFVAVGTHKGCMSMASRMKMHELSEHIVYRKIQNRFANWTEKNGNGSLRLLIRSKSMNKLVYASDNGSHLQFTMLPGTNGGLPSATMDDEKVCLPDGVYSLVCFSRSENISLLGLIGNLLHFDDGLVHLPVVKGKKFLLTNNAFAVEGGYEEDKLARASLANARTRHECLESKKRAGLEGFHFRFKYAESAAGVICSQYPQLKPRIMRISQKPSLLVPDKLLRTSIVVNTTATCIGLFPDRLSIFWESGNSSMVCYHAPHNHRFSADMFCGRKHSDGTISLSKTLQVPDLPPNFNSKMKIRYEDYVVHNGRSQKSFMFAVWTISWKAPDLELRRVADIARHALLSFLMSRNFFSFTNERQKSYKFAVRRADAKRVADELRKGIPKLKQLGESGAKYVIIRAEERATVITWVFVLWVVLSFSAACFLLFIKLKRPRLIPDLDFLYRHSVMQQYAASRSTETMKNPPTVCLTNTGMLARLHISYENIGARKTHPGDRVLL